MAHLVRSSSSLSKESGDNNPEIHKSALDQNDDISLMYKLPGIRKKGKLASMRYQLPGEPVNQAKTGLPPLTVVNTPKIVESRSEGHEDSVIRRGTSVIVDEKFDGNKRIVKSTLDAEVVSTELEQPSVINSQQRAKGTKTVYFSEIDALECEAYAESDDTSSTDSSLDITVEEFKHEVVLMCSYESFLSIKQAFERFIDRFIEEYSEEDRKEETKR
jgi:hypothetical protein